MCNRRYQQIYILENKETIHLINAYIPLDVFGKKIVEYEVYVKGQ